MAAYVPLRVPWPVSIIVFSLVVKKTDGDFRVFLGCFDSLMKDANNANEGMYVGGSVCLGDDELLRSVTKRTTARINKMKGKVDSYHPNPEIASAGVVHEDDPNVSSGCEDIYGNVRFAKPHNLGQNSSGEGYRSSEITTTTCTSTSFGPSISTGNVSKWAKVTASISNTITGPNNTRTDATEVNDAPSGNSSINVEEITKLFGVSLKTPKDIDDFTRDIKSDKHDLWWELTREKQKDLMGIIKELWNACVAEIPSVKNVNMPSVVSPSEKTMSPSHGSPILHDVDITKLKSYVRAVVTNEKEQPKVISNFCSLVADPVFDGVNIFIPCNMVEKVSLHFEHTLYGYFIGKRMAFLVVEYYARNNWAKHGLKRTMMNAKGFFFFKFDTRAGLEAVLEGGPWMIRPSEAGSLGVIIYCYDGQPTNPLDPYVEAAMQAPPPPVDVPAHVYPEYMPQDDDVFPAKEQPLPATASPTADSPNPVDYLFDVEEDEEPSEEEEPSKEEEPFKEEPSEEEEEHIALTVPASTTPPSSPPTSPQHIIPSSLTGRPTTRMSVRPQPAMAASTDALIATVTTALPLLLPLSPLPALLPQPIILLYTRVSMVLMRAVAPSTYILAPLSGTPPLLPIPLPTLSLPLPLPSTDRRADVLEAMLPPRKRLCLAPGPRFEVGESSFAAARSTGDYRADYGFIGTLDAKLRRDRVKEMGYWITDVFEDPTEAAEEIPPTTVVELSQRVPDLATTIRQDIDEIYLVRVVDQEARHSRVAWMQSMDASQLARFEVMTLRTTVSALQTEVGELRAVDRRRQTQLIQILTQKMPPKQTRGRPTPASTTNTTPMIDAAIRALIAQGVADAIAECEA
ncbi:reverse transcriptase domain-containing protein [Tanacetum coccineum]